MEVTFEDLLHIIEKLKVDNLRLNAESVRLHAAAAEDVGEIAKLMEENKQLRRVIKALYSWYDREGIASVEFEEQRKLLSRGVDSTQPITTEQLQIPDDKMRLALVAITNIPAKPFPDAGAHSWHAFGLAVHRAYCDIQRLARGALGSDTVMKTNV